MGKTPMKGAPRKLKASARAASQDDYEDEPTMKLGTAVIVVLVLHIVAVGGVYAFNSIKAERLKDRGTEIVAVESAPSTLSELAAAESTLPAIEKGVHRVESGETLASIARASGVSLDDLLEANDLRESSILRIGQELRIPNGTKVASATAPRAATPAPKAAPPVRAAGLADSGEVYTVVGGDNPVAIARRFKVSYNDLMKINEIDDPRRLQIGQKLKIPVKR